MIDSKRQALWLGFDKISGSSKEILEYEVRRPLFAASAILTRQSLQADRFQLEGELQARLPLGQKKELQIRAETDAVGSVLSYEERDRVSGKVIRWHRAENDQLICGDNRRVLYRVSAPVQSSIGLLFGIFDRDKIVELNERVAFFTAGRHLMAIRLRQISSVGLIAEVTKIDVKSGSMDWNGENWSSAHELELEWNRGVRAIHVSIPFLGRISLKLVKHERM